MTSIKLTAIFTLLLFLGCQEYNSNSFDKKLYGKVELSGGPKFEASYAVLQNRCMNCHEHSQWAEFTNKQQWIDSGLVVPNSADNSPLIYRIINHGGASSDMPLGGGPIPSAEYNTLVDWVNTGYP